MSEEQAMNFYSRHLDRLSGREQHSLVRVVGICLELDVNNNCCLYWDL